MWGACLLRIRTGQIAHTIFCLQSRPIPVYYTYQAAKAGDIENPTCRAEQMETSYMKNEKVYQMDFTRVYPLLVNKAVRTGRTQAEVDQIICRLTGYTREALAEVLTRPISYEAFFAGAPQLHANRVLIKGSVCGIRVEEIQEPPCGRSAISTS